MAKIFVQKFPVVWQASGSLPASGSISSGSVISNGYARLIGIFIASASVDSLRVLQSADQGANWDYWTDYAPSACSGSAFSIEIVGNAVKIEYRNGSDVANEYRTLWQLRPV